MKKEIKKRVKPPVDGTTQRILDNLDKYVEDLATTSAQMDDVIASLLSQENSLTSSQKAELKKSLTTIVKDEATFCKKLDLGGKRVKQINKMFGDKS